MDAEDEDMYDYLTTTDEVPQSASAALADKELYDIIGPRDDDDVVCRTSTIDPDIDDDMYDYIGTHERLSDGDEAGVGVDDVQQGAASDDELYDYPPLRSNPAAVTCTSRGADESGNWSPSAAIVVERKQSTSSLSSEDHYDVLSTHPASSPNHQLAVRKSNVSESAGMVDLTGKDLYDFITPKDATKTDWSVTVCPAISSEAADGRRHHDSGRGSVTSVLSIDDHYDVLPTTSDRLSVRKPSANSAASTGSPLTTVKRPTTSSTLLSSQSGLDIERTTSSVTRCDVSSAITSNQSLQTSATFIDNEPSRNSKPTTILSAGF